MSYSTVTAAETASDVASSTPAAASSITSTSSRCSAPIATARRERLQAGLMLLALLSLTVAFWAVVIGLAVKA